MRDLEKELKHSLDEAKKMNVKVKKMKNRINYGLFIHKNELFWLNISQRNFSEMLRAKTEESRSKEAATRSIGESLRRLGLHV